jgi:hypothetical protein
MAQGFCPLADRSSTVVYLRYQNGHGPSVSHLDSHLAAFASLDFAISSSIEAAEGE